MIHLLTESKDKKRKRLRFRCWHRGSRELDLLLGRFADAHIHSFSMDQLDRFEVFIENADPDIYNWLTGREEVPEAFNNDIFLALIRSIHR